ncbi:MAG: hypothetical protein SGPRY_007972, partial [Prymnesium sp.]
MYRRKSRFHLLLLEHGERFIDDHAATLIPSDQLLSLLAISLARPSWKGRIHCGSRSLTFEPEEAEAPLLRVLLSELAQPLVEWGHTQGAGNPWDSIHCETVGEGGFIAHARSILHKQSINQPFVSLKLAEAEPLRFSLVHTRVTAFVEQMGRVQRSLSDRKAQAELQAEWRAQQQRKRSHLPFLRVFDLTGLVDPLETHLLETRVERVRPMVSIAAILLLSESRVYLQVYMAYRRVARRTIICIHVSNDAFEWWQAGVGSGRMEQPVSSRLSLSHRESLLLNFASHAEREAACEAVARARLAMQLPPLPPPPESRLPAATEAWRVGRMSNFDYLMLLNECAGRSLNDLTQYP